MRRRCMVRTTRRVTARAVGTAVLVTAVAAAAGCDGGPAQPDKPARAAPSERASDPPSAAPRCRAVPPRALPDGSRPGRATTVERGPHPVVRWGSGANRVVQQVGRDALGLLEAQVVTARVRRPGPDAAVMHVGDPGVGETAVAFTVGGCAYTVRVAPEVGLDDVRALARGIGTRAPTLRR